MVVDSARSGIGTALLVVGPPGAGRSSVLTDATAAATDVTVVTGGGVPTETTVPFSGLSQLLAPRLADAGAPSDHADFSLDGLPVPQAAALRCALGLAEGPTPPLAVGVAVLTLLTRAAAGRPVLVVVDDLHLLDPDSTAALLYAARRLANRPVAALLAAESPLAAHLAETDLPVLALGELDEEAAGELLADHGWSAPPPVRRAAVEATGGNPLALIQLATTRSPTERLEDVAIQVTVPLEGRQRASFLRQLALIPSHTRKLLVLAAAAGDAPASSVHTAACALGLTSEAMEPAERAGVITVRPGHIAFRHPLLRAAIYQDAPHSLRIAAHRELADALAALEPDQAAWHRALATTSPDEDLASTLEEIALRRSTGTHELAVMLAAARLSAAGPDRDRRTTHAALAAWGSGQSDMAHDLGSRLPTVTESETTARLVWLQGLIEIAGSDPITAFARLERLAGELAPAAPEHAAMLRLLAVTAAYDAGELTAAKRAASAVEQAGGPSRRLGELFLLALEGRLPAEGSEPSRLLADLPAEVHKRPGMADSVAMVLGGLGPHLVLTREFGVSACAAQRSAGVFGTLAMNLLWLTDVHLQLGHCDDAADCAEEVLRLTRDTGQRSGAALALAHLARVAAIRGAHGRCRELAADALTIAVATRTRAAAAHATWAAALAALAEGDAHEACDRLVLLIEPGSPFFHELIAMRAAPDLVEAAVRTGQLPLAHRVTTQLADWAARSTLPWARAHQDRCLALIAEDDEAHRLFARASEAAAASNRPFDLARTALLRGEALRRDRRRLEARTPLRLAVELFDGQGARRWAEIARSQLRGAGGLGTSPRDDRPVSAVLTAQELQVARLAANGLSNKEIGALLFVSPRTVAYHLYKIFPKLGISARSQLRSVVLDDTGDGDRATGDTVDTNGHREPGEPPS